jgi:hypothetical protein
MRSGMSSIFLSYSHKDAADVAEYLYTRLSGAGYSVWKDNHNIPLGKPFPGEISKSVIEADYFVILLSKSAVKSSWVDEEVNTAKASQRHIIPILLDELTLPPSLSSLNYLDMINPTTRWKALHRLVNNLDDGKTIPRVYNMSGHSDIEVDGVLVLDHSSFKYANLDSPDSVYENAEKLAKSALPYLKDANAGIVPHGHSTLALTTLAYLLGVFNQMPKIYWPQKNVNGQFGISKENHLSLQDIRDQGLIFREESK